MKLFIDMKEIMEAWRQFKTELLSEQARDRGQPTVLIDTPEEAAAKKRRARSPSSRVRRIRADPTGELGKERAKQFRELIAAREIDKARGPEAVKQMRDADAWRQAQFKKYGKDLATAPKSVISDPRWVGPGERPYGKEPPPRPSAPTKTRPGRPRKPLPGTPQTPLSSRSPSGRVVDYPAPVIDPLTGKAVPPPGFREPYATATKGATKATKKAASKAAKKAAGRAAGTGARALGKKFAGGAITGLGADFAAAYADTPEAAEAERLGVSPQGSTSIPDWMRKEEDFIASIVPGAARPAEFKYRPLSKSDIQRINNVRGVVGLSDTPGGQRTTKSEVRNLINSYLSKGIPLKPWMKRITKRLPNGQYSIKPRVHGFRKRTRVK